MFSMRKFFFFAFILTLIVYFITSPGETPFDYFTRLAHAFLNGKYYLTTNPPWLNELVPLSANKFAVVYPPGPALISIPFVLFLNESFKQQILAHFLGAAIPVIWAAYAYKTKKDLKLAVWIFILTGFGNIIWYLSSVGSVWYLGQVTAAFFLSFSILSAKKKWNHLLTAFFLGMAFLSRYQTILALPFVFLSSNLKSRKKILSFSFLLSAFFVFFAIYNYLRFGSILETGYILIPGVLQESWYSKGLFHLSYIPNNFKAMFLSLPIFLKKAPYIQPSWAGLSVLITSPVFIYICSSKAKKKVDFVAWVTVIFMMLLTFSHGGIGFTQFGYRYAVDFYPIIFYLIINALKNKKLGTLHWILLIFSVIVNLWGVLWINKFGWVSF